MTLENDLAKLLAEDKAQVDKLLAELKQEVISEEVAKLLAADKAFVDKVLAEMDADLSKLLAELGLGQLP